MTFPNPSILLRRPLPVLPVANSPSSFGPPTLLSLFICLPQAEEALRLVRIGYRNGRFPLIEVLSAAEARDAIREALITAQQDRGQAAAELIRLAAQ